jgi:hypothetical protein
MLRCHGCRSPDRFSQPFRPRVRAEDAACRRGEVVGGHRHAHRPPGRRLPGQSGNPAGGRKLARHTWPRARDILHKLVIANQAEFEQKLGELMLTKNGALQVLELLAKLNREIGSRADEAPAVRIVIGGNIPLEGMRAVTPPALPPT